uniref:Cytochrome P450 n=1 Tax=Oryza rufipogon TaxID=4529 RepID=A0A0E0QWV3_ORYRU
MTARSSAFPIPSLLMANLIYYSLLIILPFLLLINFYKAMFSSRKQAGRLPPCPWQLPIMGSIHHLIGDLPHRSLRDLSRRYGPVMLLKFGQVPFIIVSSPEAAKDIMKTHDSIFATRPQSEIMKIITKRGQGLVFAPYDDQWRQLRKICIRELLCAKRVQSFCAIREEEAARLVKSISSDQAHLVNLSKKLADYATDAAIRIITGTRFENQEVRDKFQYYQDEGVHLAASFCTANLCPSLQLGNTLSRTARKAEIYREGMFAFIGGIIDEHQERRAQDMYHKEDLIDVLLRIQQEGSLESPDILAGGSETVTTVLQWAMTELMRNPTVMSKAQDEVREVFKWKKMFVIKETVRLHTPGPLFMRECQEQCQVMGYDVPKGTKFLLNLWSISRDPKYWDDPETFKPERFENDARDFKGNDFEFIPFGAGRRMCPGMLFGLANIELALANLLFYFDWSLPDGVLPSELDMTENFGVTVRKKEDLLLHASLYAQLSC